MGLRGVLRPSMHLRWTVAKAMARARRKSRHTCSRGCNLVRLASGGSSKITAMTAVSTEECDRALEKRSMRIGRKRTSLALEPQFWRALSEAASREGISMPKLVLRIEEERPPARSLASAVRVFLLMETP